jgi:hypothetical protein
VEQDALPSVVSKRHRGINAPLMRRLFVSWH